MSKPKVLVIGSNSFSGSHFVATLQGVAEDQDVRLVFPDKVMPSRARQNSEIEAAKTASVPKKAIQINITYQNIKRANARMKK